MTRVFIRSIIIRAVLLMTVSLAILFTSHFISVYQENIETQEQLQEEMSNVITADHYFLMEESEYELFSAIQSVIIALDELERPVGYIIDVKIIEDESALDMRLFLSDDAETIIQMEILSIDIEKMPSDQEMSLLLSQFEGARIPIALSAHYEEEYLAQNEYPPMPGLYDGTFYAEAEAFNNAGYKDFVMITVVNGRITEVIWDAIAQDEGKNREQASVDGEFPMPEGQDLWAAQAHAIQRKLIEVQDPNNLAIRSDGRTEIIENVDMNVQVFLSLVNRCIEDARNNRQMSDEEIDEIDSDNYEVPEIPESSRPTLSEPYSKDDPTPAGTLLGDEDGVVDSEDEEKYISETVDGLALSEIRTKIEGIEDHTFLSSQMVSGVNEAYKFVRSYLRWGGS